MKKNQLTQRELEKRGFDAKAYGKAIAERDEDRITLEHPFNFMTEGEVEEAD